MPFRVRSLEELGAPAACNTLLNRPYGIVLSVGPTGSGKSTTLAAMIDRINETKPVHILTIEDPVEYLHHHKRAMVNQREVGTDVESFTAGLRSALREDPDVVLLGEMRDLDSIQIALSLAETGHLVFATLHTNDAPQALDRIVDVFPGDRRDQIQTMLAGSLQGVVSQRLLPAINGGRVAAFEVLMGNDAVRNLVREGKSRQLRNVVATGGPGRHADDRDGPRPPRVGRSRVDGGRPVDLGVPQRDPGPGRHAAFPGPGAGDGRRRPGRDVGFGATEQRVSAAANACRRRLIRVTSVRDGGEAAPVQVHRGRHAVSGRLAGAAGPRRRCHRDCRGGVRAPQLDAGARLPSEVRVRRHQRARPG